MNVVSKTLTGCFSAAVLCFLGLGYFFWHLLDGVTERSDKPVAYDPKLPTAVPLPHNATDIYYLFHVEGLQVMWNYTRFSVPTSEVDDTVKQIIEHEEQSYQKQWNMPLKFTMVDISASPRPKPDRQFLPMPWWDTSSIKSGSYIKADRGSYTPEIWVDREHGAVFVYVTD